MAASISTEHQRATGAVLVAGGAGAITAGLADYFRTSGRLVEGGELPWGDPASGAWIGLDQSGIHDALARIARGGVGLRGIACVAAETGEVEGPHDEQWLWRRTFDDVVISTDHLIQAGAELLDASSSVVVVLSAGAVDPYAEPAPRAAAMAACRNLTQSWALVLAPHGVRVNAICVDPACITQRPCAEKCQAAVAAVSFLLSPASMDVTGQTLSLT